MMNRSVLHLHSPRSALALCVLSMSPLPVALADDGPPPTAQNDMKAAWPNVEARRTGRHLPIRPRHRPPTAPPLAEYGLIVGHTRHTKVGGPQHAPEHRAAKLN